VSEQTKLTDTSVLFQPAALGEGFTIAVIVGGVLSILRVTLAEAVSPAASLAVPVIT
jgi:hypothetical protein